MNKTNLLVWLTPNFPIHSINLRKEVADGLRIYFDFTLEDYLLYKEERPQAIDLMSQENIKDLTYADSEKQYVFNTYICIGKFLNYKFTNTNIIPL